MASSRPAVAGSMTREILRHLVRSGDWSELFDLDRIHEDA